MRRVLKGVLAAGLLLATAGAVGWAQDAGVVGTWKTPEGSVVEVHACGGDLCLRLEKLEPSAPGSMDENNPDAALRSRSLCGLEIGKGFHAEAGGTKAEGGSLYDPKSGKTYSGSLQTAGAGTLKLRGYVGVKMFGRTEQWTRVGPVSGPCFGR